MDYNDLYNPLDDFSLTRSPPTASGSESDLAFVGKRPYSNDLGMLPIPEQPVSNDVSGHAIGLDPSITLFGSTVPGTVAPASGSAVEEPKDKRKESNRAAAKRSREKKNSKMKELEDAVTAHEQTIQALRQQLTVAHAENTVLRQQLQEHHETMRSLGPLLAPLQKLKQKMTVGVSGRDARDGVTTVLALLFVFGFLFAPALPQLSLHTPAFGAGALGQKAIPTITGGLGAAAPNPTQIPFIATAPRVKAEAVMHGLGDAASMALNGTCALF